MNKPNLERIQLLVDALRSGKFRKTTGFLAKRVGKSKRYCCLGVGCEVARRNGLAVKSEYVDVLGKYRYWAAQADGIWSSELGRLPSAVADWYGISGNPLLKSPDGISEGLAIDLNDEENLPLAKIADWFEATYLTPSPNNPKEN